MELERFLDLVRSQGWRGMSLWGVLAAQALLWVSLLRLFLAIRREEAPWDECSGKIRSALLRQTHAAEEADDLRTRRYAPILDSLVALHFQEATSDRFDRFLLLGWKVKEGLRPYWIRWGHLLVAFGVTVWFLDGLRQDLGPGSLLRTPCDPRLLWVWLGCAMLLAWKLVRLEGNLERIQRSLLVPRRDE